MARKRRVVVHARAERAVNEIKRLAILKRRFVERIAFFGKTIGCVNVNAATRPE